MTETMWASRYKPLDDQTDLGLGSSVLANDLSLQRIVRVRELHTAEAPHVETLLLLHVEGIAHVYDAFEVDGRILLVTPPLGAPVAAWARKASGTDAFRVAVSLIKTFALALEACHPISELQGTDVFVNGEGTIRIAYAHFTQAGSEQDSIACLYQALQAIRAVLRESAAPRSGDWNKFEELLASVRNASSLMKLADQYGTHPFEVQDAEPEFIEPEPEPSLDDGNSKRDPEPAAEESTIHPNQNVSVHAGENVRRDVAIEQLPARRESRPSSAKATRPNVRQLSPVRTMPKKWIATLGGAIVCVLAVAAFLLFRGTGSIPMPDIRGESLVDAKRSLVDLGWHGNVTVQKVAPSAEFSTGQVVSQVPEPGQTLVTNQTVTLSLASVGGGQQGMPNVVGVPVDAAIHTLTQSGIAADQIQVTPVTDAAHAGQVDSQSPAPGHALPTGTAQVTLSVAVSDGQTIVPNVVGLPVSQAGVALINAGLHYHYDVDQPGNNAGVVASQSTAPGSIAQKNTSVELHVYTGK